MSNIAEFKISYDGSLLTNHLIEVKELAPALLAFNDLLEEANRVVNRADINIKLNIKATSPGSFTIIFNLQTFSTQAISFLNSDNLTAALNLVELIGLCRITQIGLFALIRKLKGKTPTKITELADGLVQIEYKKESFIVPIDLLKLYQNINVRKSVQEILQPLKKEGIDQFKILNNENNECLNLITKDEISYYELPEIEDSVILDDEFEAAYSIISLAFKEGNKWRLFDGNATINAIVKDVEFLKKVERNEISFSKGDTLICHTRKIQYQTKLGLRAEFEVKKVNKHIPAPKQLHLFETSI